MPTKYPEHLVLVGKKIGKTGDRSLGEGCMVCLHCGQHCAFNVGGQSLGVAADVAKAATNAFKREHGRCKARPGFDPSSKYCMNCGGVPKPEPAVVSGENSSG